MVIRIDGPYSLCSLGARPIAMTDLWNWVAFSLITIASLGVLLNRDWRWSLVCLALQYLGVFWLVQNHWLINMAASKLIAGWMACAILGIAQLSAGSRDPETAWPQGWPFRLFTAGLVLLLALTLALRASSWLRLSLPVSWGGLLLMVMGLLYLGNTAHPFRVILGLLTVMAGFEILYAAVENSIMVAALLAVINLGLALAGAYLLSVAPEETE